MANVPLNKSNAGQARTRIVFEALGPLIYTDSVNDIMKVERLDSRVKTSSETLLLGLDVLTIQLKPTK
jgi:hypothetical protein